MHMCTCICAYAHAYMCAMNAEAPVLFSLVPCACRRPVDSVPLGRMYFLF